jgi:hypothetical protein
MSEHEFKLGDCVRIKRLTCIGRVAEIREGYFFVIPLDLKRWPQFEAHWRPWELEPVNPLEVLAEFGG